MGTRPNCVARLVSPLDHHSMPTVGEHVRKMIRYTTLGAQEKLKAKSRITALDVAANHLVTAGKTYLLRRGYRDGVHGLVVALFAGMHVFVKYAKAWESLTVRREASGVSGQEAERGFASPLTPHASRLKDAHRD